MDKTIPRNQDPQLRKIYKILEKIAKKLGREDAIFSAQKGVSSDKGDNFLIYAAMINAPRAGLEPITFADVTGAGLIEKLQKFLDEKIDVDQVEIAYHEAQILANERSVEFHKEKIEAIKNPPETATEETPAEIEE
jgi:hypothetical protein